MKLNKFNKNKKRKSILIGSIIGILLIIGGISLYRSFAMYKVEKTFDVLQGTIPDFRKTKTYTEELLNGADPVLDEEGELVPVKIGNNGEVTKADITQEWYSYEKKEWANAVILTDAGKQQNIGVNEKIEEQYIESYFVWIPKYRYKLFDMGNYQNASSTIVDKGPTNAIAIEFGLTDTVDDETKEEYKQCKTPMNEERTQGVSGASGKCQKDYWMTHPAFISFGANGFWVGKFETGYKGATSTIDAQNHNTTDKSKVVIKPNVYSWTNITVGNMFKNALKYKESLRSHMMKNTEWGAIAYLTNSIYGRCTNNGTTTCEEVRINNNSGYVTGYAAVNVPSAGWSIYQDYESKSPNTDGTKTINYKNSNSVLASTTKNYSGIYDMSGGASETMMGVMNKNVDGLTQEDLNDSRYFDSYNSNNSRTVFNYRILGDAIGEMGPFANSGKGNDGTSTSISSSWYNDLAYSLMSGNYYPIRGQTPIWGSHCGIFSLGRGVGGVGNSFRIVLALI